MKNLSAAALLALTFATACTEPATEKTAAPPTAPAPAPKTDTGFYEIAGDSAIIPLFEVQVLLSPKASEKLSKAKETIIVHAMFEGEPTDKSLLAENGELPLIAEAKKTLPPTGVVSFKDIKFPKKVLDGLADKDIELLVNVYSGRKSSKNNLLQCGLISQKMSAIAGKNHLITCKLIEGDD